MKCFLQFLSLYPPPEVSRPIFPPPNPPSPVKHEDGYDAWLQGSTIETDPSEETKPPQKTYFEPIVDSLMLDDDDSMESGVGWDDEGVHFASSGGIDDFEGDPLYLDIEDEPEQIEPLLLGIRAKMDSQKSLIRYL